MNERSEAGADGQPAHESRAPDGRPAVVAVGASAGELASLDMLVSGLPPQPGRSLILVFQHREALDEARLKQLLEGAGHEPLVIANDMPLKGGRTYVCPPGVIVALRNHRFETRPAQQPPGERGTIDSLLLSLAQDCGEDAVGVVLHGTAGDGTLGVAAIKECDGLTIAEQLPDGSEDERLNPANSPRAIADFVLPASRIPERIGAYSRHLHMFRSRRDQQLRLADLSRLLEKIAKVLRAKTGHDFNDYKPQTFMRRIQRRMQVRQVETIEAYLDHLQADPEEVQSLFNDLLIGVTQFFRDPKEFDVLEKEIVPSLLDGKGAGDFVRVWILGCATGEEAYSIGILLREQMSRLEAAPHVQIFATDIDGRALASARVGRYPVSIANDVSPERLTRWFVKEGDTYLVAKELREMCIFSAHNVIRDAPFSRLDLIACRNLLIYLNPDLQNRIIPLFHFALLPGRYLFLGGSENVTRHPKLFAPVDRRARIFRRLDPGVRLLPDFPLTPSAGLPGASAQLVTRRLGDDNLARRAERIAERYAPAYVIVDDGFEVLHFSGRTGPFIEPTSGAASLEILNLVHRDLRPDLRAALMKVAETDQVVQLDHLPLGRNGNRVGVDLVVEPMRENPTGRRTFVIIFKERNAAGNAIDGPPTSSDHLRDEHVQRLESELRLTRDRLQATIEELESTNEELKSSNEEYQSLNEELQSANEELETSREELQSVNEELTTVNGELAHRVQELTRATSDLKNFLESTQIATLFLDNELNVMNFTPAVSEIFHLIETDIGRPIAHIRSRLPFEDLQDDIRRVLRTLSSVERGMENPVTHTRYIVRILPYRSIDNFIAGVVITFVDVTELTQAEAALRESEERFRSLAQLSPDGILIETAGQIAYANPAAARLVGASNPEDLLGRSTRDLIQPRYQDSLSQELESVRAGEPVHPIEVGFLRLDGNEGPVAEAASGTIHWDGNPAMQIILRDITERKQAEARQQLLLGELQHRVRNTMAMIRSIARRTALGSSSVEEFQTSLEGRLNALARTQALVTRNTSATVDLRDLARDELAAVDPSGSRATISGPSVSLKAKAADSLGLALHELATNALKHGALGVPEGRVDLTWTLTPETPEGARLVMTWKETGIRLHGPPPTRKGFGTELLDQVLQYELKATSRISFEPDGMGCTIEFPLRGR